MKCLQSMLLFASLCSTLAYAQDDAPGAPQPNHPVLRNQLLARVDAFMHAWESKDAATLTATMAPDFLYVSLRGVTPREGVVGALTHACTLTTYSLTDVRVLSISSNAATLVYKLHQSASCAGHADSPVVLNTDTLVRREGKWLFLLTTSTPAQ